jgi:SAM-dependent methyltransferase
MLGFPVDEVLAQPLPSALQDLHVNYRYLLSWAQAVAARRPGARILDFGCGPGTVVQAARGLGLECSGADAFYEGEQDLPLVRKTGLFGTAIRKIEDGRVPFDDASFDLIVSNQVLEHVRHLDGTLSELFRLLKPDGRLLVLCPTREVVREAHCGVPFLHWLDPASSSRVAYAARWKWAGVGFDKERKSAEEWAREAVSWMDRFVFYRSRHELRVLLGRRFELATLERHYLSYRLRQLRRARALAPLLRIPWLDGAGRAICHRFNGIVVLARKKPVS